MEVLATPPFKRIRLSEGNGRVEEGNGLSEEGKKEEGGWLSSLVLTPVKFVSSLWKRGEEEEEESRKEDESGDDEREEDLGWRRSKRKRKRGAVDSPKSSFERASTPVLLEEDEDQSEQQQQQQEKDKKNEKEIRVFSIGRKREETNTGKKKRRMEMRRRERRQEDKGKRIMTTPESNHLGKRGAGEERRERGQSRLLQTIVQQKGKIAFDQKMEREFNCPMNFDIPSSSSSHLPSRRHPLSSSSSSLLSFSILFRSEKLLTEEAILLMNSVWVIVSFSFGERWGSILLQKASFK
mmetsp:Transcript_37252/g.51450  ORF Transcript_37252/g.51450 Transcript_37252/m.51450 type:complete len:295 (+) Transcript_37252:67-951(+)